MEFSFDHTLSHESESIDFTIEPSLFAGPINELAEAIIKSIDENNGNFGHYFHQERFDYYAWSLDDDNLCASLANAATDVMKQYNSDTLEPYGENPTKENDYKQAMNRAIGLTLEANSFNYEYDFFYDNSFREHYGAIPGLIVEQLAALENIEINPMVFEEEFEQLLGDAIADCLAINDKTDYSDLSPVMNNRIEVNFTKGFNWLTEYVEDRSTSYSGCCSSLEDIIIDDTLTPLFTMANVSPQRFAIYLWESKLYSQELIDQLNALEDHTNPELPECVDCQTIITILDNATSGGIPTFTCYVSLGDWILRKPDQDFYFNNGVLGLEEYCNGSGHNESVNKKVAKIVVTTNELDCIRIPNSKKSIDNVYGFAISYISSDIYSIDNSITQLAA